jgi:hypothetical protein
MKMVDTCVTASKEIGDPGGPVARTIRRFFRPQKGNGNFEALEILALTQTVIDHIVTPLKQ